MNDSKFRSNLFYYVCSFILLTIFFNTQHSQAESMIEGLEKFKKAVVHLECAADSKSYEEQSRRQNELQQQFREGKLSADALSKELLKLNRDYRSQGTAIFLQHENRRYLITARHVLYDVKAGIGGVVGPGSRSTNPIYYMIYRVPSLDNIINYGAKATNVFLMNLEAGPESMTPYSFSDPKLDLAIISLDAPLVKKIFNFADKLILLGHVPITIDDIADEPSGDASPVFIVGYLASTSNLVRLDRDPWRSDFISLPTFSFGRVAMLHKSLPYFLSDISAYPGDSGAPVVEEGKIVGIVSKQAVSPSDIIQLIDEENIAPTALKAIVRIPFSFAIKAKYIKDLLEIQKRKDQDARRPLND